MYMKNLIKDWLGIHDAGDVADLFNVVRRMREEFKVLRERTDAALEEVQQMRSSFEVVGEKTQRNLADVNKLRDQLKPQVEEVRRRDSRFNNESFDRLLSPLRQKTGNFDGWFGREFSAVRRFNNGNHGAASGVYLDTDGSAKKVIYYCSRHGGGATRIDPHLMGPLQEPVENIIRDAFA